MAASSLWPQSEDGIGLIGPPLPGMDKYTGAAVGDDGCLYAVPGTALRVLRIDPRTLEVKPIGRPCDARLCGNSLPKGRFKWLRGIAAADSRLPGPKAAIYCIPCNAHAVLKIVPRTRKVSAMTHWTDCVTGERRENPELVGCFKWHGGVLAPDGNIYAIPANSMRVLMIVPSTGEVRLVGPPLLPVLGERSGGPGPLDVAGRWYGGLLGSDGSIYGMPCNADCVLKITPQPWPDSMLPPPDPVVSTLEAPLELGNWDYHGGIATKGGHVLYAVPMHASRVLSIVPETGTVRLVGKEPIASLSPAPGDRAAAGLRGRPHLWQAGRYQYGGAVLAPDGVTCYFLPYDALQVLKVGPSKVGGESKETEAVELGDGSHADFRVPNKWQNGFVGRDGLVYAIPVSASAVLRIQPNTDAVDTLGHEACAAAGRFDKWEGGVVSPYDGALYCVPQNGSAVLRIAC